MRLISRYVKEIKQPKGGLVPVKYMEQIKFDDGKVLGDEENIGPGLIGTTVDYVTRKLLLPSLDADMTAYLEGSRQVRRYDTAEAYLNEIKNLSDKSLDAAIRFCGFDVINKASIQYYTDIEKLRPNKQTLENVRVMVQRCFDFFEKAGPIANHGVAVRKLGFFGAVDYVTQDSLYDLKTTKNRITSKDVLQAVIYGKLVSKCKRVGIFNPRQNIAYVLDMATLSPETNKALEDLLWDSGKISEPHFRVE